MGYSYSSRPLESKRSGLVPVTALDILRNPRGVLRQAFVPEQHCLSFSFTPSLVLRLYSVRVHECHGG